MCKILEQGIWPLLIILCILYKLYILYIRVDRLHGDVTVFPYVVIKASICFNSHTSDSCLRYC